MADSSSIETRSKKKKSSSKSKKKSEEVVKPTSPPTDTGQDEAKTDPLQRSTDSPDPNCSICLGKLENKSFTDSCFHMFCFVCLLEWSKVKNECPLCKQSFKSIIHNVRSYEDYDQYHLTLFSRQRSPEHPYSRNFRYRTTLTEDRVFNLRNRVIGNPVTDPETVLQLQAIGAPTNYPVQAYEMARQNWNRRREASTSDFRRRIYTNGMRLTGIRGVNNRVRECSPAFFTRNPALTHRLVPWLNRELNALLHNEELHVQFLLELIMGLIKRFDIGSEDFYQHVSAFIGRHTRQFMREFESFAKCPYCMVVYDKKAIYEHVAESVSSDSSTINSISDDDSDVQFISSEVVAANDRTTDYINLPDISSEIQVTSTVDSPRNFLQNSGWMSPTPGPSWGFEPIIPASRQKSFIPSLNRSVGVSDTEVDSSADSLSSAGSDVQVVAYDKPWEERSPINLSSETEIERPAVKEKKTKEKKKKKKSSKSKESNNAMPSTSIEHHGSILFSQSASFTIDGPSSSSTHRRKKHKSRSWRDSHYRNRANILFHRRSTSPEMSDSGRRKMPGEDYADSDSHRVRRKRKHKRSNVDTDVPSTSFVDLPSSSHTVPSTSHGHSAEKRKRRDKRSPSVEILSIHKKKKHKKHKHKHSHKHSKVRSSVVVVGNTEQPSQEDTDAYEDEPMTSVPPTSVTSSAHTSETSGSARSFIDVVSGVCDTLNPVEIASNIAQRSEAPVAAGGDSELAGVLDLTSVNLEEVHDDVLKESLELETPSSTTSKSSCKKHPTGHKKSRSSEHSASQSLPTPMMSMNQSFLPSFSSVMMRGDPLMGPTSRNDSLALYSNVLQSFQHAFLSDYNPHPWHRRPAFPLRASDPKYYNSWIRSSTSVTSMQYPQLHSFASNEVVDVDALPLDLRQGHDEINKWKGRDSYRSGGIKSSTVTSSQRTSISSDESVILSPTLDIVTVDESHPSNLAINQSNSIPVISVSGSDDSSSDSNVVDSTDVKLNNSNLTRHNNENSDLDVFGDSSSVPTGKVQDRQPSEDYYYRILKEQSIPTSSGLSPDDNEIDLVGGDSSDSTIIHGTGEEVLGVESDVEICDKSSASPDNNLSVETESNPIQPSINIMENSNILSDYHQESNSVCLTSEPLNVDLNCDPQPSTNVEILDSVNNSINTVNSMDKESVVPNSQEGKLEKPISEAVNLFTSLPCAKMLEDCSSSRIQKTSPLNDVNFDKVADSQNRSPEKCDSLKPCSSSEQNSFWKKRQENPLMNSDWRNEESSNETEDSESSSTDSYDYDSFK